jgi:hypothetical protein
MTDSQLNDMIEAGAAALDLPIEPAWRDAVRGHLRGLLQAGAVVMRAELPDSMDAAEILLA